MVCLDMNKSIHSRLQWIKYSISLQDIRFLISSPYIEKHFWTSIEGKRYGCDCF